MLGGCAESLSLKRKTGSWRVVKPIVTDKCIGCGRCVDVCPEICISIVDKKACINYEYCKGCMLCASNCPIKAIEKNFE